MSYRINGKPPAKTRVHLPVKGCIAIPLSFNLIIHFLALEALAVLIRSFASVSSADMVSYSDYYPYKAQRAPTRSMGRI